MEVPVTSSWAILSQKVQLYKELSKSGIVTLVVLSVFGGYLAGHPFERTFDLVHFLITLIGVFLLASGSSAWNQVQEREIDRQMPRTANRPLPSGRMTLIEAQAFCAITATAGLILLSQISLAALLYGVSALVSYNWLYTAWWKKKWAFAAIPGAVPGALPALIGYVAAAGDPFAPGGVYLFSLLFFWQMPHFWVLALRYRNDYAAGGIPTLPVSMGSHVTVRHIVLWCLGYIGIAMAAPLYTGVGPAYMSIATLTSIKLIWELVKYLKHPGPKGWLKFFLWVNFSLLIYLFSLVADLWSVYLLIPLLTR